MTGEKLHRYCVQHPDDACVSCYSRQSTPTPTHVLSEVAETTAGEREVEAWADVLLASWAAQGSLHPPLDTDRDDARQDARAILASPALAALLDRVRREEGAKVLREAAVAFAWAGGDEDYRAFRDWLRDRAASVGRGDA